jgi:hypothetical protein
MAQRNTKAYATQLLDRLIELDATLSGAYYEIGRILSAIQHSKLWETLGYESMSGLIEEELTFSPGTGFTYLRAYRRFRQLHYTESEALELLTEFGISRMSDYLASAKVKAGKRAIKNAIEKWQSSHRQINFTVDEAGAAKLERVLKKYGAVRSDNGRWEGSGDAFGAMLDALDKNGGNVVGFKSRKPQVA